MNATVKLLTGLWSNYTNRTNQALRVLGDLDHEELKLLTLVTAYVNPLDDLVDLECIDCVKDKSGRGIYILTALMTNCFPTNHMVRRPLSQSIPHTLFDLAHSYGLSSPRQQLPHSMPLSDIKDLYISPKTY